jgi:hypothetical protein
MCLERVIEANYDPIQQRRRHRTKLKPDARYDASNLQNANDRYRRYTMKRYENSTPRATFALVAVALTAITLGLSVVIPASMETSSPSAPTIVSDAPTRVARIDVIAVREPKVASMQVRANRPI